MDRRWQWLVASVWNGLNVCALTDEVLDGLWEYPSHLVEIGNKNFQLMVKQVEDAPITPQHKLRFLQQERDKKGSRASQNYRSALWCSLTLRWRKAGSVEPHEVNSRWIFKFWWSMPKIMKSITNCHCLHIFVFCSHRGAAPLTDVEA